jgi:hypothetical protein
MMKLRKIVTLATAGTATAGLSLLGFGVNPAAAANGVQPVTFEVAAAGSLSLAQTPTAGTALVEATAVDMPVTTVTDSRNGTTRNWTVTATASDLTKSGSPSILAAAITVAQTGSFTTGTGTLAAGGLVTASAESIDSVYTYTPTATLAAQGNISAGIYSGTVTQTVV